MSQDPHTSVVETEMTLHIIPSPKACRVWCANCFFDKHTCLECEKTLNPKRTFKLPEKVKNMHAFHMRGKEWSASFREKDFFFVKGYKKLHPEHFPHIL